MVCTFAPPFTEIAFNALFVIVLPAIDVIFELFKTDIPFELPPAIVFPSMAIPVLLKTCTAVA